MDTTLSISDFGIEISKNENTKKHKILRGFQIPGIF